MYEKVGKIVAIYAWISMMLFYFKGKYSHWIYRILKVKLIGANEEPFEVSRADIEDINRNFVWKELYTSFLTILEPLQFHQLFNSLVSIFPSEYEPENFISVVTHWSA